MLYYWTIKLWAFERSISYFSSCGCLSIITAAESCFYTGKYRILAATFYHSSWRFRKSKKIPSGRLFVWSSVITISLEWKLASTSAFQFITYVDQFYERMTIWQFHQYWIVRSQFVQLLITSNSARCCKNYLQKPTG